MGSSYDDWKTYDERAELVGWACDDCWGDGCFCKVCDQIKSDCECTWETVDPQRWIAEVFEVEDWREVDLEDARTLFDADGVGDDTRWQVCTTCGGGE